MQKNQRIKISGLKKTAVFVFILMDHDTLAGRVKQVKKRSKQWFLAIGAQAIAYARFSEDVGWPVGIRFDFTA